jgi:hypothetical protein
LKFPLFGFPVPPTPSLGGGRTRFKPFIPITVIGPRGQDRCDILADSGADDVVFPIDLANRIGINLTSAPQGSAHGVGGRHPYALLFAPVILLLQDQIQVYRWRAVVGFTSAPMRFPLFGIAGGLEHFRTTLDVRAREIELLAQPSLPTTQDPVP